MNKKRIRPKRKIELPQYLYDFLTEGKKPGPKNEGVWYIFCLKKKNRDGRYGGLGNVPFLKDLWALHKKDILKSWKGPGKTFAEKLLEEEKK